MKNLYNVFSLLFLLIASVNVEAQHFCIFDHSAPSDEEATKFYNNIKPSGSMATSRSGEGTRYLPVVFHVIHSTNDQLGEGRNLSTKNITDQLEVLNNDFNFTHSQTREVPSEFYSLATSMDVEFQLANMSPDGRATTGITRTVIEDIADLDFIEEDIKSTLNWDPTRYINIYVLDIPKSNVKGFAHLPTAGTVGTFTDGIVLDYKVVGGLSENKGRTLTHEMGHYFGLYHTWGKNGDCQADDYIEDTPQSAFPTFGCPEGEVSECGNSKMYMNFMDYASNDCALMFTKGQVNMMSSVLEQLRPELIQTEAIIAASLEEEECKTIENTGSITQNSDWSIYESNDDVYALSNCISFTAGTSYKVDYYTEDAADMNSEFLLANNADYKNAKSLSDINGLEVKALSSEDKTSIIITFNEDMNMNVVWKQTSTSVIDFELDVYTEPSTEVASAAVERTQSVSVPQAQAKKSLSTVDVVVGPNPTVDVINIYNLEREVEINVFDAAGKILKTADSDELNAVTTIDIQDLEVGMYFVQLFDGADSIVKKIFKK